MKRGFLNSESVNCPKGQQAGNSFSPVGESPKFDFEIGDEVAPF